MDAQTTKIIKRLNFHSKIRYILTIISYFFIIFGVLLVISNLFESKNKKFRIIADYKNKNANIKAEKIMINPRIKYDYNPNEIYSIDAKKAIHIDENNIELFEVSAQGDIGLITSGKLKIKDNGNNLIFSEKPSLIINKNYEQ